MNDLLEIVKLKNYLKKQEKQQEKKSAILWILAIAGAIAATVGIAYAIYRYFSPCYCIEDFDDDFEDELFEDDFDLDEDEEEE